MQRGLAQLSTELDSIRKQLHESDVRKADKRELLDITQKLNLHLDSKIDKSEVHGVLSDFTQDQAQKTFTLRKELYEKVT